MWLVVVIALVAGSVWVLANEDTRAEIADWLSIQLGSTPTPIPVVINIPDTPTPTLTPTPPVPIIVAPIPTLTPTPKPTPSPTAEPTRTAVPSPTSAPPEYSIDDVNVKLLAISEGMFSVDFSVLFRNVSAGTGQRPVELLMSVDEGEPELITIISGIAAGEAETFVFSREFSPGRYSVTLIAGDARSAVSIDVAPATVALVVPTATPTVTPTPTETPAPRPTATPTSEPSSIPHPSPTEIVLQASPTPIPTTYAVVSNSEIAPHLRHLEYKQYMLELINAERTRVGLGTVVLGDNNAAQLHAEASIEHCFSSHWGIDGLKPYMRYSLAGGYQSNGENGTGSDYCIVESDGYRALGNIRHEVLQAMDGWMDSPGHRHNILRPWHRKINIGISWDRYNFAAYQHFEGDYVGYDQVPDIRDGNLTITGTLKNGATIKESRDLGMQIYYDPPPRPLTRGQVSRTYCYDSGLKIAALRPPLPENWSYPEDKFTVEASPCPDPYDVPADATAPQSHEEAGEFWKAAYEASRSGPSTTSVAPWITANQWNVASNSFSVLADLGDLVEVYGDGVYSVMIWAIVSGERAVVSQYSIFHGVTPPDTYNP